MLVHARGKQGHVTRNDAHTAPLQLHEILDSGRLVTASQVATWNLSTIVLLCILKVVTSLTIPSLILKAFFWDGRADSHRARGGHGAPGPHMSSMSPHRHAMDA